MKITSISITCLLLISATGFSQNNIERVKERQHQSVSCLLITEKKSTGFLTDGYHEQLIDDSREFIRKDFEQLCFPKKIFKNNK